MILRLLGNLVRLALFAAFCLALRPFRRPLAWVWFKVEGDLPYRGARRFWQRRREPTRVVSLHELGEHARALAKDPRLSGVVIEVCRWAGGAAKQAALAEALAPLKQAGKQVVGWAETASNGDFEALCVCDRILLAPTGRVELTGFSLEATSLGAGLRRLGVHPEFVRRGDHKTAPETFTRDDVSPIQDALNRKLLAARRGALVATVAQGRRLSHEGAAASIDEGPYSAQRALTARLIDQQVRRHEVGRALAGSPLDDEEAPEARVGPYRRWRGTRWSPPGLWRPIRRAQRVLVIPVAGIIAPGRGGPSALGPQIAGVEGLCELVDAAARARSVGAVVLHVESPGGSAQASEVLHDALIRAGRKKPVVAYVDRVAASGGYLAAVAAKEIWSAPLALTGSIGVFAGKFDVAGLLDRVGVRRTVYTEGRSSALHSVSRGFTPEERATLEREVDETYQTFIGLVALGRRRTREEIHARAEGRVYTGAAAVDEGLVDRLGTFEEACRRAWELAGARGRFEIAVARRRGQPLSLARLVSWASGAHLWALWWPWLELTDGRSRERMP